MTKTEWHSSADPQAMLHALRDRADERQLRRFTSACCRRIWHLLPRPDDPFRGVLELSDRLAEDAPLDLPRATLYLAAAASCAAFAAAAAESVNGDAEAYAAHAIYAACALTGAGYADDEAAVWSLAADAAAADEATHANEERTAQAEVLRDVFGHSPDCRDDGDRTS